MRRRLGIHQKRALLDIVEETFYYMQGNRPIMRRNLDKPSCWRIIAGKLNKMGPMRKEPNGWKKAWCCMKCKVREKYKKLQKTSTNFDCIGDVFDPQLDRITNEDWRVIKLCNIRPAEVRPANLINLDNAINFLDPEIVIKSPPTSDEEDDMLNAFDKPITSAFITIKQLTELTNNPVPKMTNVQPIVKINDGVVIKPPSATQTISYSSVPTVKQLSTPPQTSKSLTHSEPPRSKPLTNSEPIMQDISKQLGVITKYLQEHSNMQRSMLKEMQKNNQLQSNVIHLLTDIQKRLPPQ